MWVLPGLPHLLIFLTLGWFGSGEDHVPAYYEERMKEGKVIKVQDVAFITYAG